MDYSWDSRHWLICYMLDLRENEDREFRYLGLRGGLGSKSPGCPLDEAKRA